MNYAHYKQYLPSFILHLVQKPQSYWKWVLQEDYIKEEYDLGILYEEFNGKNNTKDNRNYKI